MSDKEPSLKTHPCPCLYVNDLCDDSLKWKEDFEAELLRKCDGCWIKKYKDFCDILCPYKLTPKEILGK